MLTLATGRASTILVLKDEIRDECNGTVVGVEVVRRQLLQVLWGGGGGSSLVQPRGVATSLGNPLSLQRESIQCGMWWSSAHHPIGCGSPRIKAWRYNMCLAQAGCGVRITSKTMIVSVSVRSRIRYENPRSLGLAIMPFFVFVLVSCAGHSGWNTGSSVSITGPSKQPM